MFIVANLTNKQTNQTKKRNLGITKIVIDIGKIKYIVKYMQCKVSHYHCCHCCCIAKMCKLDLGTDRWETGGWIPLQGACGDEVCRPIHSNALVAKEYYASGKG